LANEISRTAHVHALHLFALQQVRRPRKNSSTESPNDLPSHNANSTCAVTKPPALPQGQTIQQIPVVRTPKISSQLPLCTAGGALAHAAHFEAPRQSVFGED